MAVTNQVNTVTTTNVVPVGAIYDADGNFVTLVGAAGTPISFSGGAGSFTTLSASSTVTFSGGTANGVAYLNGSKVLTSGSALVFDGTNLGIGTTSSQTKLTVGGFGSSVNSQWNGVAITTPASFTGVTGNIGFYLYASNGGGSLNAFFRTKAGSGGTYDGAEIATDNRPFRILTSTTEDTSERLRVDTSGNLLVGTTSGNDGKIKVDGTLNGANCAVWAKSAGGATSPTHVAWNNGTTGDNKFVEFYTETSATVRGSITYNRTGGLTAYNTTSDYRAKNIIGLVQDSGATIDALKVYEGQMKGATQSRPMLIAHEAQAVTPYAVTGEKDAVKEDGTPDYQQMDVSSLVPLLIAEIQSLRIRIAQLEAK